MVILSKREINTANPVFEARFETRSGDIKYLLMPAQNFLAAVKAAAEYKHAPDQVDWELTRVERI